jgi:3-phenylpropionate/cinnamic acid dioxygenase small subunit
MDTPHTISAYDAIRNLLATYSYLLDSADYPRWAALFGEDGTLEVNGEVWARGEKEIARKQSDYMAASPKPITGFSGDHIYRHMTTNIHITVSEDAGTAEAEAFFFVLHVDKGTPAMIRGGGRYHDKFTKVSGFWRFAAKRLVYDWYDA